ncbi:hypothetical protein V8B97DRAFT_2024745 [Scleroderma yunnanense]
MATTDRRIFFTGTTGYVGGSILSRLIDHPTYKSSEVSVLIRPSKKDKSSVFESLGLKPVIGTNHDLELLTEQASQADVVFSCADADDLSAAEAVLKGLKQRHERTGTQPILIHTVSVLTDNAKGLHSSDIIYDDLNLDQIASLPPTQLHRNVDLTIQEADKEGYIRSYIILPSTIYSLAETKLVELGVQNPRSLQIPMLIREGIRRGQAKVVGEGKNRWPNVHIDDIADLFIVVYENALSGKAGHGRDGYYFGENGEHRLYDVAKEIAKVMHELGKSKTAEPEPFTGKDYEQNEELLYLGTNSRCRAHRGRLLGWNPKHTTEDLFKSIGPEMEYLIKHEGF